MRRFLLLAWLGLIPAAAPVARDDPPPIDRVEEDWELVIRTTDVPAAGPQITTTMCPGPIEDHPDVNFNLNYREGGTFAAGGLQVEIFEGKDLLIAASARTEPLATENETITWTQKLTLSGGTVAYQVKSGRSTTWGDFGGDELSVTFASALSDLGSYSPDVSMNKSGVGWQSDHVASMKLVRVRYYSGDTLLRTDDTPRLLHPSDEP